jgi:hypothetical protein
MDFELFKEFKEEVVKRKRGRPKVSDEHKKERKKLYNQKQYTKVKQHKLFFESAQNYVDILHKTCKNSLGETQCTNDIPGFIATRCSEGIEHDGASSRSM